MHHERASGRTAELAIASHAAAALDRYERLMLDLVARGGGAGLHRRATEEIESIRKDCASLPRLSLDAVELSISHAELIFSMLKADLLGETGERRLQVAVRRNQKVSEHMRVRVAHILSTRGA